MIHTRPQSRHHWHLRIVPPWQQGLHPGTEENYVKCLWPGDSLLQVGVCCKSLSLILPTGLDRLCRYSWEVIDRPPRSVEPAPSDFLYYSLFRSPYALHRAIKLTRSTASYDATLLWINQRVTMELYVQVMCRAEILFERWVWQFGVWGERRAGSRNKTKTLFPWGFSQLHPPINSSSNNWRMWRPICM